MVADLELIVLKTPIKRGSANVSGVMLRRPEFADLEGVSMVELASGQIEAIQVILPRVTKPSILSEEIEQLDINDLERMTAYICLFLLTKKQRAAAGLPQSLTPPSQRKRK